LTHKIDLLRAWLSYNKPSIITLSETWLNSEISDADVKLDGYTLYRADRATRGGGVATYISSHLSSELIMPKERAFHFECLFVNIAFHETKRITIGNIYRPPNSPFESTNCILATISYLDYANLLILMGDFNRNWLDCSSSHEKK
jgi:exonuclease III